MILKEKKVEIPEEWKYESFDYTDNTPAIE